MRGGFLYMMTNKPHGVLYTGVTANLPARAFQHREGRGSSFCKRYNCTQLVLAEEHPTIVEVIAREKSVKQWPRLWKLELVHAANPEWRDLYETLNC